LISERTFAALAAAKARGQALGNPKLAKARAIANANHSAGANTFADSVAPAVREAQAVGAKTLRQIAAALNGRGIGTARGGKWEATTVANVLRRISGERSGGCSADRRGITSDDPRRIVGRSSGRDVMKTHSEHVKEILAARKTAVHDQRCVAIAEIDDCSLPCCYNQVIGIARKIYA
jgi:hypothetical protein